ncbi:helix-turn-helix transcriptional regulator [Streptomyces massasporeus]|uniref:helix-turn-helix domain-containing protein n=1 Tax=Streptomyces massasporeus TaxID=67324 RepID=UPI0033D7629B
MADPDGARTPEEFTQALRQLVSETGKSPEDIAKKAGLSGNTVRGITAGKNWPQQRTLEQLVRACGQDTRPWVNAWSPLNDARPRTERGNAKNVQEQIDALGAEVDRLHGQVRSLQESLEQGEMGDRRRERRIADAYFDFLATMPTPEFRRAELETAGEEMRAPSPLLNYSEPAYGVTEVNFFLDKVKELATAEGLPQLALYLATSPLLRAFITVPAYEMKDHDAVYDYVKSDVDAYITKLRACVHQYLRDCTDDQSSTQTGGGAAPRTSPAAGLRE